MPEHSEEKMIAVALWLALSTGMLLLAAVAAPAAANPSSKGARPLALIVGGGSGGHVFPGLAVAEELIAQGWRISMAGSSGGLEARLAHARGHDFYPLAARPLLGRGALGKARALWTLARSTLRAVSLVRDLKPRVVIGTGGYLSAPGALGGVLARRPLMLIEPNAEAGLANRWLSRWASGACVAHQDTGSRLRCPVWATGVPVRADFFAQPSFEEVGSDLRLLVLGGSQGALALNRALPAILLGALGAVGGSIVHQAGPRHCTETLAAYRRLLPGHRLRESEDVARLDPATEREPESSSGGQDDTETGLAVRVEVAPFLDDVAAAMGRSHLIVSRAGAVTLAEICAAGRGSILIPLPIAAGHQRANAQALENAGAALLMDQEALVADAGTQEHPEPILALVSDRDRLAAMASRARELARPAAARGIARRAIELASGRSGGAA